MACEPPADGTAAAMLKALEPYVTRVGTIELVRRVEMDGKVSETRVILASNPTKKDAA